jgi:fibronectin type III domain protein
VGYGQITLRPGQSRRITVTVNPNSSDHPLSYYNTTSNTWSTAPGKFTFQVGSDSQTTPLNESVRFSQTDRPRVRGGGVEPPRTTGGLTPLRSAADGRVMDPGIGTQGPFGGKRL